MAIIILTDSTSDISQAEANALGITVIPLQVAIDGKTYRDGIDIAFDSFYDKLKAAKQFPTTSQPSPEQFLPHFEGAKERGDTIIAIMLSSELSGTYQSAVIAQSMVDYDGIFVIDSLQTITGLRMLTDYALRLISAGKPARKIADILNEAKNRITIFAFVDTLEYLVKGGRMPRAVGMVGTLLNIKPLIQLKNGSLGVLGKARGMKSAFSSLMVEMHARMPIDSACPVYIGYTENAHNAELLRESVENEFKLKSIPIYPIGSVIGSHVGGGAAAITFLMASK